MAAVAVMTALVIVVPIALTGITVLFAVAGFIFS